MLFIHLNFFIFHVFNFNGSKFKTYKRVHNEKPFFYLCPPVTQFLFGGQQYYQFLYPSRNVWCNIYLGEKKKKTEANFIYKLGWCSKFPKISCNQLLPVDFYRITLATSNKSKIKHYWWHQDSLSSKRF